MTDYEFHEIAKMFPMLSEKELRRQTEDIKKNGLIRPILLFEGKILDGRNRYRSCKRAGVELQFEVFDGTFAEAVEHVWIENIHTRDLTSSQRAAIIVSREDIVKRVKAEARERQIDAGKLYGEGHPKVANITSSQRKNGRSATIIAKLARTNRQYVSDAIKIKHKSPELFDMVKNGILLIADAIEMMKMSPDIQEAFIDTIDTNKTYFIVAENGMIKIGQSRNPDTRLANLQTMSPESLYLLHTNQEDVLPEHVLHERFDYARHHGEWFTPCKELIDYITTTGGDYYARI